MSDHIRAVLPAITESAFCKELAQNNGCALQVTCRCEDYLGEYHSSPWQPDWIEQTGQGPFRNDACCRWPVQKHILGSGLTNLLLSVNMRLLTYNMVPDPSTLSWAARIQMFAPRPPLAGSTKLHSQCVTPLATNLMAWFPYT